MKIHATTLRNPTAGVPATCPAHSSLTIRHPRFIVDLPDMLPRWIDCYCDAVFWPYIAELTQIK